MIGKLVGSYEIKGLIGEGQSSVVYRAIQPSLGRPVAIKRLKLFQTSDPTVRERFRREALAQSKLSHPGIAVIYDFVRQYESYFIIMEMLKSRSLREIIADSGAMEPTRLMQLLPPLLEAIQTAHSLGILHGDLRPSNVFLDDSTLKLTDFGVSRIIGTAAMLSASSIDGRVRYLSPEEIKREPVDERSDIYSLGALLYEMATGKAPFSGQSAFEIMERHVKDKPPSPRSIAPQVPELLEALIERAMEKSPDQRFQNIKEMDAFIKGDKTYAEVVRLNKQAFKLYNQKNYRPAIAMWQQVLKLDPNNAKAQGGIARARTHLGETDKKDIFEAALESTKSKPPASGKSSRSRPGRPGRRTGLARAALSVLYHAITSPESLQTQPILMFLLLLMVGVIFFAALLIVNFMKDSGTSGITVTKRVPLELHEPTLESVSAFKSAGIRDVREDRQALVMDIAQEAQKLCEQGRKRKALAAFEKAMELDNRRSASLVRDYALCCVSLGTEMMSSSPDTALEFFRKALSIYPESHEAYLQIGRVYSNKRQFRQAIASYRKSLSMNSEQPLAHFNLGHAYLSLKEYADAAKEFQTVIDSGSPLACDAYINLGVTYYNMGKVELAGDTFAAGLASCPDNEDLLKHKDKVSKQLKNARNR